MGDDADLRFTWAMRRTSYTPAQAHVLVHALADVARDAAAAHFPASEGYQTSATELHGMLDGVRVCVSKGEFSAVVSTQCYLEPAAGSGREVALRQVAAVHRVPPPVLPGVRLLEIARPALLLIVGSALVFAVISTLATAGLGGYFRLTLWMSFMIMMAPAVAWLLGARASLQLEAIEATRSAYVHQAHSIAEHESRWRRLLHVMHDRQALVLQQRALPFRRG
ncbi:MAG: hypothetical protein JNK56_02310 [Myxococcales bacterium]|nr:hypothetical protein [Myxococcales bacterium]